MKILVIDEWYPWPLENGKKIRTYNLMSRLARHHEILYMAYADPSNELDKLRYLENKNIRCIYIKDDRIKKWSFAFYLSVMMNYNRREPYSTIYHVTDKFKRKLKEVLSTECPDLVHCEWTNLAPLLKYAKDIPTIITSHNIESDIWYRWANNARNPAIRILAHSQARKIERLERIWYPKADYCIAVSKEDARVIESYGARVSVVDNGVDVEHYNIKGNGIDPGSIIFVASYETFSNQDAAIYFMKEIFPIISKKKKNVKCLLVGKDPTKKMKYYANKQKNIIITGTVPDVRDYISKAEVYIVPIRIAGGSRLKILEAMAMKKPIVSTTIGAEGLQVENRKNIMLADSPGEFADNVIELLSNKSLNYALGMEGWRLVKNTYDWENLSEKQNSIWIQAAR